MGKSKFGLEAILALKDMATGTMTKVADGAVGFSKRMKKEFKDMSGPIKNANKLLNKGLAVAAVGLTTAIGYGIKANIEYADALAKISTVADTSVVSMDKMSQDLLGVSSRTGKAVTEISEAAYQAISAGVATADAASFAETATKSAVAGFTDSATSIDALTTILNAYGLKASEVTRISDQLITTQNLGKTTFGELSAYLGQVVPIASSLGVQTDELFSSIAALTMQGIKSGQAVTSMKAALSNVIKPTDSAAKMAAKLGINFSAAALKEKGLAKFMAEVGAAAKGDTAVLAELFGSVEALNAVTVLTGKGAKTFTDTIEAMKKSTGATDDAFEKINGTVGGRLRMSMNKLQNVAIKLGDKLAPAILTAADYLDKLGNNLGKMDFSAISGLVQVVIWLVAAMIKLWPILLGVAIAIKVLSVVTGVFNVTLSAGPVGLIILAITALVVIIILCVKHWKEITGAISTAWKVVSGFAVGLWNTVVPYIKAVGATIMAYFLAPVNMVISAVIGLLNIMSKLPGKVGDSFKTAAASVSGFQDSMNQMLTGTTTGSISDVWKNVGQAEPGAQAGGSVGVAGAYANPATRTAESRSYKESVSRSEVYVRPDKGAAISDTAGGRSVPSLALGTQ